VADDGCGGVTAGGGGTGLRGLDDRVDAVGGTLRIDSPPSGGTRIVAEIPCES
jgi:signal transduction histidine kinase